jgi:hypothetical protein
LGVVLFTCADGVDVVNDGERFVGGAGAFEDEEA